MANRVGRYQLLWWSCAPLLPFIAAQGVAARKRALVMPEAAGPRDGVQLVEGTGPGSRPFSLVIFGESTAAGVGVDNHEQAMAGQLAQLLAKRCQRSVRWRVVGRTGLRVKEMRRELVAQLQEPVDLVVVLSGVNDVTGLTRAKAWLQAVGGLRTQLQERGAAHVLFAGVPPVGSFTALPRPLRDVMGIRAKHLDQLLVASLAGQPGVSYAPTLPLAGGNFLAADGFHPSALGYAGWAEQLLQHLQTVPELGLAR